MRRPSALAVAFLSLAPVAFAADATTEAVRLYQQASQSFLHANYREAAELLRQSIALAASDSRPVKLLGICYQLTNDFDQAGKAFLRASEINPNDPEARFYLARVYYLQNLFDKALESLEIAQRLKPHDVRVLELMALTHEATSQIDRALADYEEAVAWDLRSSRPLATLHLNYGVLLHKLNRLDQGEQQLLRAEAMNAQDWQAPFELAKLHATQGNLEAAVRELKVASKAGSASKRELERVHRLLAQYCAQLGREDESREALAMAQRLEE